MLTFQDYIGAKIKGQKEQIAFIEKAITQHASSDIVKEAELGAAYFSQQNPTIKNLVRMLYDETGAPVVDDLSQDFKFANNYYKRNITQLVQYTLSNGVTFKKEDTKASLGGARLDWQLVDIFTDALSEGRAYGFLNVGKLHEFRASEFAAFMDETSGEIRAGLRMWRVDAEHPLYVTLFEEAGYVNFIQPKGKDLTVMDGYDLNRPRPYSEVKIQAPADATALVLPGESYSVFPIVPAFGNRIKRAEIYGKRGHIDGYDLIESGFARTIEEASEMYWTMTNADGMTARDIARWKRDLRATHVAKTNEETSVQAHTVAVPTESRETILTRIERDIYNAAMALDVEKLTAGNVTATAINAACTVLDQRADELERCVFEFVEQLLKIAGIDDTPKFRRARLTNQEEVTQMLLASADHVDTQTILEKIPWIEPEEVQTILDRKAAESVARFNAPIAEAEPAEPAESEEVE